MCKSALSDIHAVYRLHCRHQLQYSTHSIFFITYTRNSLDVDENLACENEKWSNDQHASNEYLKVCSIISGTSDCSETQTTQLLSWSYVPNCATTGKPSQSTEMLSLYNYVTCKYRHMIYIAGDMQQSII